MKELELYDCDEVVSYLRGGDFIKMSPYFRVVALIPSSEDDRLKLSSVSSVLVKGQSFTSRRNEIRTMGSGCDMYYQIDATEETKKMREDLSLGKTLISVDDEGLCKIQDKKYFILYPIDDLNQEMRKRIKDLNITLTANVWVSDDNGEVKIEFDKPASTSSLLARAGYVLKPSDVQKIYYAGLGDVLLSADNFEVYAQNGNMIERVEFDDRFMKEYDKDKEISVKPAKDSSKILSFYEYDPLYEDAPSFGESYEIEPAASLDGETVWKLTPKIVQNEHVYEYAMRAAKKGVRVVRSIPNDETYEKIEKDGMTDHVKEFIVAPGMKDNYLLERPRLLTSSKEKQI